jgi:hypothetical protein
MIMSWIEDKYDSGIHSPAAESSAGTQLPADRKWSELLDGLKADADDFSRLGGKANFERVSETECRVSNPAASISAILTEDPSAPMIRYIYTPDRENVAVPEGGVLTLRVSGNTAQFYSADQQLTPEQARRMILEPLLFPSRPSDLEATGT